MPRQMPGGHGLQCAPMPRECHVLGRGEMRLTRKDQYQMLKKCLAQRLYQFSAGRLGKIKPCNRGAE